MESLPFNRPFSAVDLGANGIIAPLAALRQSWLSEKKTERVVPTSLQRALWIMGRIAGAVLLEACSSVPTPSAVSTTPDASDSIDAAAVDSAADATMLDAKADSALPLVDASAPGDAPSDAEAGCPPDGAIPDDLACTGLYSDWATKTVAVDALPYTPGLVFWSDGAIKSRWIYLPPGSKIDTTDMDDWVFPIGTKIWKSFSLDNQLIETRLVWKQPDATWAFLDYRWSADGSSAQRLRGGQKNVGGTSYEIPAESACPTCHAGRNDIVLGFDFVGLGISAAQGVTLASLATQGKLTAAPPTTSVVIPEDTTGKAAAALGWLHVNCGVSCHSADDNAVAIATHLYTKILSTQLYADAGADGGATAVARLDAYTTEVNVPASLMPGGQSYLRIAPGDATRSLVPLMALARGDDAGFEAMPTLVSHIPDTAGVALVTAWIDALAVPPASP